MKNLYIIGDSFAAPSMQKVGNEYHVETWSTLLKNNISEYEVFINGEASIDAQTILENWLKLLPHINDDDIIIICLPSLTRIRLPLKMDKNFLTTNTKLKMRFVAGNIINQSFGMIDFSEFMHKLLTFIIKLQHL